MDSGESGMRWVCVQFGAREGYAIPRALHRAGRLAQLITDAWVPPGRWGSLWGSLPLARVKRLQGRFHEELAQAPVSAFTAPLIGFELIQGARLRVGLDLAIARNKWFQGQVARRLEAHGAGWERHGTPVLFIYSYAGLELLRWAKRRGWRTVLGQIDPGPLEETLVAEEHARRPAAAPGWRPVPREYWDQWREECHLSDRIVVNSAWSELALQQAGISRAKIRTIPLAYSITDGAAHYRRVYPALFSQKRPMRVLFLGQIILRKGLGALLEAAEMLRNQPVEFWMVGSMGISTPPPNPRVTWIGPVPRSQTSHYYREADIFLFPTLSDGFGLTQLEAQAWKLPIIASSRCGAVVANGHNGLVLPEVTGQAIAVALQECLDHPQQLAEFAHHSVVLDRFSLSELARSLHQLAAEI